MVLVKFLKKKFRQFLEEYLEVDPAEKQQMSESLRHEQKPELLKSMFGARRSKKSERQFERLLAFKVLRVKVAKFADALKDLPLDLAEVTLHELEIHIPWKSLFSKSVEIKVR